MGFIDFYVLKENKASGLKYAIREHGAEFTHKGVKVRTYIDKNHTMHFVDPESGRAYASYCLPFIRGYDAEVERTYLRSAKRYLPWKNFRWFQSAKEKKQAEYKGWIRMFHDTKRYESEQEVLDDISKGM